MTEAEKKMFRIGVESYLEGIKDAKECLEELYKASHESMNEKLKELENK